MSSVIELFGMTRVKAFRVAPPSEFRAEDFHKVASNEIIGIEVEVENARYNPIPEYWTIAGDGSLRNNGVEMISRPIEASSASAALFALMKQGLDKTCSFTPRTSVHVHLNVQDLEVDKLTNILLLYTLFERSFFRFVGRRRHQNPYCVPLINTALLRTWQALAIKTKWEKYTALNYAPVQKQGTIEFRHMHGTFDVQKLSIWIDLITSLKEYVKKTETQELRRRMFYFQPEEVGKLATEVFPNAHQYLCLGAPSDFIFPLNQVKMLSTPRTHVSAWAKTIDKESAYFKVKI